MYKEPGYKDRLTRDCLPARVSLRALIMQLRWSRRVVNVSRSRPPRLSPRLPLRLDNAQRYPGASDPRYR